MESMIDIGVIRGVLTAIVFAAFMGLVFWAYSGRRESEFGAAAQLPLEDDTPVGSTSRAQGESS
ncbi:MAG: cbb3-type cytochrome oxidase subunit 3 [Gammaproteobacteria bacterium]